MARDIDGIIKHWHDAREHGTMLSGFAETIRAGYTKADGSRGELHPDTIQDIKEQADLVIPLFEAALVAMKTAYTP